MRVSGQLSRLTSAVEGKTGIQLQEPVVRLWGSMGGCSASLCVWVCVILCVCEPDPVNITYIYVRTWANHSHVETQSMNISCMCKMKRVSSQHFDVAVLC